VAGGKARQGNDAKDHPCGAKFTPRPRPLAARSVNHIQQGRRKPKCQTTQIVSSSAFGFIENTKRIASISVTGFEDEMERRNAASMYTLHAREA
jgi:hypothetical protein